MVRAMAVTVRAFSNNAECDDRRNSRIYIYTARASLIRRAVQSGYYDRVQSIYIHMSPAVDAWDDRPATAAAAAADKRLFLIMRPNVCSHPVYTGGARSLIYPLYVYMSLLLPTRRQLTLFSETLYYFLQPGVHIYVRLLLFPTRHSSTFFSCACASRLYN